MARLTEEMVIARSKQSDLAAIKKLNCWGAELGDVSLLRRMPNVEVLALSINKIRTLTDFAGCRRLRELYVRKNDIRDLREIRHLRRLPVLTSLWLDENPCTTHPEYRMTVLRNLPNLEKLDNVPVQPEEVTEAMRRGVYIPDSDDEGYPQQESYGQCRRVRSCESSPEREPPPEPEPEPYHPRGHGSDSSEGAPEPPAEPPRPDTHQYPQSPTRRAPGGASPDSEERYEYTAPAAPAPAMTRSHYEARSARSPEDAALRHSLSAHSVKEYSYASNGECRAGAVSSPHQYHDQYYERPERCEYPSSTPRCPAEPWEREAREYPSAVMAEHRGFTRRPVTRVRTGRNSNLLSAVLCLVKELDYPSLEVAEMAVRCRMDELANAQ
ncbi:cilia- and flagella-associated protein 410 isoform X2 [Pectinophora gossypiella]|uniref:cilia- and flagella-associated protein 410 isoform X2 n=1 Tax=Pectinophora gossypiella TaxID=13191 RepID=UPI00214E7A56|nr:cilia- and flagella-associated protein 410 isoform X2 [Pectinophora gossypiella]